MCVEFKCQLRNRWGHILSYLYVICSVFLLLQRRRWKLTFFLNDDVQRVNFVLPNMPDKKSKERVWNDKYVKNNEIFKVLTELKNGRNHSWNRLKSLYYAYLTYFQFSLRFVSGEYKLFGTFKIGIRYCLFTRDLFSEIFFFSVLNSVLSYILGTKIYRFVA